MNEEKKSCQVTLERQIKIAQSLQITLSVLNSNKQLDEVLNFIVNQAKELLAADAVAIYATQGKDGKLQIEASKGLSLDYIQGAVIPMGMGATGLASLSGNPVAIEEIDKLGEYENIILDDERKLLIKKLGLNFHSLLAVPLIFENKKSYGTLTLYFIESQNFTEEDISLAKAYADQTILAIENTRLRESASKSAALAERNRLARELHDTVNQTLFSMSLITDVIPNLWQTDQTLGLKALKEVNQLNKGALMEMRSLLFELQPAALFSVELELIIQQLVNAFSSHHRITVDYTYQPIRYNVPPDVKFAFYRVIQETLRNIEKHSHASHIKISLKLTKSTSKQTKKNKKYSNLNDKISVLIEDDGIGFYPGNLTSENFGLRIMQERAVEIGASLNIESEPGAGTRISFVW